jgi:hypothetical protein
MQRIRLADCVAFCLGLLEQGVCFGQGVLKFVVVEQGSRLFQQGLEFGVRLWGGRVLVGRHGWLRRGRLLRRADNHEHRDNRREDSLLSEAFHDECLLSALCVLAIVPLSP